MPQPWKPDPGDQEGADDAILLADASRRGWRRRAVATTKAKALGQIPRVGVWQTQMPIEAMRHIQRHVAAQHIDQARWVRYAIVSAYLAEGGDPDVAVAAMSMQRQQYRRRDVPRDVFGQPRNREGHKPR